MSPPEIVLTLALLAFSGWMLYEHKRLDQFTGDEQLRFHDLEQEWLRFVGRVDKDEIDILERLGHLESWRSGYPDTPPPDPFARIVNLELGHLDLAPRITQLEEQGAVVQRGVRALAEAYKSGESVARDNALRISLLESPPRNNSTLSTPSAPSSAGPGLHAHAPYVYHVDDDGTEQLACCICSNVLGPKVSSA